MANEATVQTCVGEQEAQEADEYCENIPPASILSETSKLSTETCSATQTSNRNGNGKSRISGLQSALTPILKYLSIGNKCTSPLPPFHNGTPKSNESVSGLSISHSATAGDKDSSTCWLHNENITLLDVTCDNPMDGTRNINCDSAPITPVLSKELKKPEQILDVNLNLKASSSVTSFRWLQDEVLPEMTLLDDTCDSSVHLTRNCSMLSNSVHGTPTCETEMATKLVRILGFNPKSLSSTLTPKTESLLSEQEPLSLETTHDCSPNKGPASEISEIISEKSSKSEIGQCSEEKLSTTFTGNLTHSINSCSEMSDSLRAEDGKKAQLQVTQDISMSGVSNSSKTSPVHCGKTGDKIQIATECQLPCHPVNVTCELSSSSEMSVQSHGSQSLASNSINVTSELQVEPVKTSCPEEEQSHNSDLKVTNQSTAGSLRNTFTTVQPSELSTASNQELNPQNKTVDLPNSNNCSHTLTESQQADVSAKSVPESCDMQNHTFEKNSLQKSSGNTIFVEAGATITNLQKMYETKANGTINYTESDNCKSTLEKPSPSPVNTATITEACPSQVSSNNKTSADLNAADPPESTFDVNPAVEENSGASASSGEMKDSLNNDHALSESLTHTNMFTQNYKADTFNLDNTLEFRLDSHITSTPMSTCKPFHFITEREEGKTTAAQKKLYGEGPSRLAQGRSEMPSNIVCDRKTFLPQPATKSLLPTMKAPLLLSKFKPAATLPKRSELLTSGVPVTRPTEALKMNAAPDALQQTTEITSSYNLRSTTAALKQPVPSLRKLPLSSIPSGIHRPVHGLKPPVAKNTVSVSSGSDKPAGATNTLVKTSQAKKHPLTKFEALPAAKKKKTDAPLPPSNVEASIPSSDTANKVKTLKHPTHSQRTLPTKSKKNDTAVPSTSISSENSTTCETTSKTRTLKLPATGLKLPTAKPLCHGCANCSALEEQLRLKDEEIRRLKEELLKCNKKEEPM